jgi:hypothetical protein
VKAWCIKGDGELYLCGISEDSEECAWEAFGRECLGWRYESIDATKKHYTEKYGYKAVRVVVTEEVSGEK